MKLGKTRKPLNGKKPKANKPGKMSFVDLRQQLLDMQSLDPLKLVEQGKGIMVDVTCRSYLSKIAKAHGIDYVTLPSSKAGFRVAIKVG